MSQTISKHVPHWNCLRAPDDSYWTKSSEHTVPFFFALTRTFESGLSLNFCPNVFARSWHFERNPDTCLCIKSYLAAPTHFFISVQRGTSVILRQAVSMLKLQGKLRSGNTPHLGHGIRGCLNLKMSFLLNGLFLDIQWVQGVTPTLPRPPNILETGLNMRRQNLLPEQTRTNLRKFCRFRQKQGAFEFF